MKKIILLVLTFFFLAGCEYNPEPDSVPVTQAFKCTFTNLKPEKHLKVSFECLERKKKDSGFSIRLYPYFPIGFKKAEQDAYVGTKLTYIMRIYKDEELLLEKKLEFPKKDYEMIKIDL